MRAIRNLIYNTSDILVALIILAVAVLLIWSRIDVIMSYPAEDDIKQSEVQAEANLPEGETLPEDAEAAAAADVPESTAPQAPADPQNYIKVTIPSGSSNDVVAGILKQAGVLSDTNDFINAIQSSQYNGAIIPGDHWIPKGSDMSGVIQALTVEGVPAQ